MPDFAADLKAHDGDPAQVRHVCMDMSAAYAKGAGVALPQAQISYDRFHVIAMAIQAMDEVRREELRTEPQEVAQALLGAGPKTRRNLLCAMRKNPAGWTAAQAGAMHWLQHSALKSARAWRLRMALREVYARTRQHNDAQQAAGELTAWTSGPGAAGCSRSRSSPQRSRSASMRSCAACAITAAMPLSNR